MAHLLAKAAAGDQVGCSIDEGVQRKGLQEQGAVHVDAVEVNRSIAEDCMQTSVFSNYLLLSTCVVLFG